MDRRNFLKSTATLGAKAAALTLLDAPVFLWVEKLQAAVPINDLKRNLNPADGLVLVSSDKAFGSYQISHNLRTQLVPSVRVVCKTPQGVATAIQWARANQVPLATRSGGHSYEGFSQSKGLVIDVRGLNQVSLNVDQTLASIGSGTALGDVYKGVSAFNKAIPAGSCPTVGVAGHTLGGGYGLLARPLGLACDSLESFQIVMADGQILNASETENSDLFWACRGGGAGSFGVVTNFNFRTHDIGQVLVFGMSWNLKLDRAVQLFKAWQKWAPNAPSEINALFRISRVDEQTVTLRCFGQTLGTKDQLENELKNLFGTEKSLNLTTKSLSFLEAVDHFSGGWDYPSVFMKGKSDYLTETMSDEGMQTLLSQLPHGVTAIYDSYGGAIRNVADDATAFAHRQGVLCAVQYYSEWTKSSQTAARLKQMQDFYQTLRPYVSGKAYFNYCDLDLKNWAQAYWGSNLSRLIEIKNIRDPQNFFQHGQSIPLQMPTLL